MSIIAAVDPNVLLAAAAPAPHVASVHALRALTMRKAEICIGIDDGELKIYEEYMKHRGLLTSCDVTKAFIKTFLNHRGIASLDVNLDAADWELLELTECVHPVEPELLAVGKVAPKDSCVVVIGEEFACTGIRPRGTNNQEHVDLLHAELEVEIWKTSDIDVKLALLPRSRYPSNEEQLLTFLRPTEDEYQEWKQPHKTVDGAKSYTTQLTTSIIDRALETACAMLNCNGGEVLVGITSEREVFGVEPPGYTRDGLPDDDRMLRCFTDRYFCIDPPPNPYVKPAVIPLKSGRRVVVIHVFGDATERRYSFDNGRQTIEYDRCGPSNRKTTLGPSRRAHRGSRVRY